MSEKLKKYFTVDNILEDEIEINKSRFISRVYPVSSAQQVEEIIKEVKKEHYKANHVCSAYVLAQNPIVLKASDDGEPGGTAGRPILNVIQKQDYHDILILVIRYFGGIKLGKGGLVRAYSEAASRVLNNSVKLWVQEYNIIDIETEYSFYQGLILELKKHNISPVQEDFTDMVRLRFEIPIEETDWFIKFIENYTNNNYLSEIIETKLLKRDFENSKILK